MDASHPVEAKQFRVERRRFEQTALLLQGGGALGSYQAGDNITDVNADAKFDPLVPRHIGILFRHAALDFVGASDGIDHAGELDESAVPGVLELTRVGMNFLSGHFQARGQRGNGHMQRSTIGTKLQKPDSSGPRCPPRADL